MRQAYQALLRAREAGNREGCPTPDELRALVQRQGDESARLARLDHVMRCAACLPEFELLRAAASAGSPTRVSWRPIALAASLLLAVGLGFALRRSPASEAPVERGSDRGPRLASPMGRVRAADATRLVWHPVPSALSYDVEVTTPSGDVRLTATTTDTVHALAMPVAGEELRWWVRARLADGEQASEVARITILP